jgi:hypothetical protein
MRELIMTTFSDQPDIEIVGEVSEDAEIPNAVHRTNIAQDYLGERPEICDMVLQEHPKLRIIVVAPHENYSVHYWVSLDIHSDTVEASEEGILAVLRSPARLARDSARRN